MINGIYYPRRATMVMKPGMNREQYEKGYWETDKYVNCVIGVANEVARLAVADGIKAVEQSPLYRHQIKSWCKQTFQEQERYENSHLRKFLRDQQQVFLDFLDACEREFRPHIFNIYMGAKQVMDRHRVSDTELKARVECGRIVAMMACANFDTLMKVHREKYGADYTCLFQQFRYTRPMQLWTKVAEAVVINDTGDETLSLTDDENLKLAYDVMARKLADTDLISRIGYVAIEQNPEIAARYASDEDLQALQRQYGEKVKGQY